MITRVNARQMKSIDLVLVVHYGEDIIPQVDLNKSHHLNAYIWASTLLHLLLHLPPTQPAHTRTRADGQ
jgi:hypothetical protein